MLTKQREDSVVELCRSLIKSRSYSGEENKVSEKLKKFFEENGFDEVIIDKYGNTIGKIKGNRPGKKILFDGHMDTVPVENEDKWRHKPFEAEICDGKIYGRGTTDMKGALAAMANAAANFAKDCNKDFAGEIYVAGVVHEECFEGVAARSISSIVKPDYVVIGEASNLNLKIGQRGRGEVKVETFGIPAHSANPEKGVNAVYGMCKVVDAIRKIKAPHHDVLGYGILELTDIKSSPYPGASVVPDYCMATYDRRLLVGETKESVLEPIQKVLDELMKNDSSLKAKVSFATGEEMCYTGNKIEGERFFPGWLFDKNETYIQDVYKELNQMGFEPKITQYNFCTNGSHYAGEAKIPTIGMGPSVESLAHTIDEYVEIDQLFKVTECYYGIMKALLK
ncbi:YgeY family selenium metabolism-linked hydrolase [uncultured Clostridium sp.]|uniref:YgeY family selenium metabolism-linked hydrolase n=1 Tax=uncultured Clostridium sp. TaxID=59620 RepID=UPI0025DF4BE2|nr:YgeY family selenium metabolism-linked hydrolase [uncultured Clostridium sp.]